MQKMILRVGDVVQLTPSHKFSGMLLVVTEPKEWGCQGYLLSIVNFEATRFKGAAYIRAKFEDIEYVGKIVWFYDPPEEESEPTTQPLETQSPSELLK